MWSSTRKVCGFRALCFTWMLTSVMGGSMSPCHPNKYSLGQGVTCQKVVLPGWLCSSCRLKPPAKNGEFQDCRSIYDLTAPRCRAALRTYASKNAKCDPIRRRQVMDFSKLENIQGLDYFVYAVCEQCCDCIPRGSKLWQYQLRKNMGNLLSVNRGNCPAHAWYDICAVWPKVRYVVRPNGLPLPYTKTPPLLCPLLTTWIRRPENNPWLLKSYAFVDPPIKQFFLSYFKVANCALPFVWRSCINLERTQQRL